MFMGVSVINLIISLSKHMFYWSLWADFTIKDDIDMGVYKLFQ